METAPSQLVALVFASVETTTFPAELEGRHWDLLPLIPAWSELQSLTYR